MGPAYNETDAIVPTIGKMTPGSNDSLAINVDADELRVWQALAQADQVGT
jgi:hypothetical protein